MNPTAVALVLASTFMHAGWNLLARRYPMDCGVFFSRMLLVVLAVGLVPMALSEVWARSLAPGAWLCVMGSGSCCGFYFFCLARSYGAADFTTVYPVARAVPVCLVGFGDVIWGRYLSGLGWLGIVLVVTGCMLAPLRSFGDFHLRAYWNRRIVWILLTALATAAYSLLDKWAAQMVDQGPATAARYGYVYFLVGAAVYAALVRRFASRRHVPASLGWFRPAVAAGMAFGAYWLVLWAYQLSGNASYVVAFRQFSVVIGVILAFTLYKEQGLGVRLAGTGLIAAGLFVIGLWGR